jgi:hypothetical protein
VDRGGYLSAAFVEYLMGYPLGYTEALSLSEESVPQLDDVEPHAKQLKV